MLDVLRVGDRVWYLATETEAYDGTIVGFPDYAPSLAEIRIERGVTLAELAHLIPYNATHHVMKKDNGR